MEEGQGDTFVDPGVELEGEEELADEDVDVDMENALTDAVPPNVLDDETRELAAGLASLDEGELLAALEGMQKAVIRPDGDKVLIAFVLASPHCAEIMGAWERGPAAATAVPVMLLLYYMFQHPLGKVGGTAASEGHKADFSSTDKESHRKVMAVKLRLDKVARVIVRTRMKDIYSHLSSSQKSRQNCALLLLSSIVLRGRALAIEIATSFDFTLEALRKLGHPPKQSTAHKTVRIEGGHRGILKQPTRVAFVELAISFLTVGDPGLLRWVLQKRPLWIGVLHGIWKDDEKITVRVLRLLKDKVMAPAFMVPRGLQSVLFGDATLEQLSRICSDNSLVEAKELAHAILLSLCTDASHGLCPEESDLPKAVPGRGQSGAFGGGQGRLLRLMLRLKVTEVDQHREVLLATARARPRLAISYLASFPLSLEPRLSPAWFNAMSLVSEVIPIASQPTSFSSLASQSLISQSNGDLIHSMFQSLIPSSLSRVVLNRGLLHVDFMVKHACLRVLLEALLCLKRLIDSVHDARSLDPAQRPSEESSFAEALHETGVKDLVTGLKPAVEEDSLKQESMKLIQSIQDIMRASLPDPSTLLATLSSLKLPQGLNTNTSRTASQPHTSPVTKKRKRKDVLNSSDSHELKSYISDTYDYDATIRLLWGDEVSDEVIRREGIEGFMQAKVVQVLAAYQMALPVAMADIGFDAFKLLPEDPTSLSVDQQKSLSALLLAATGSIAFLPSEEPGWFVGGSAGFGSAYKNFKQMLMFMLMSAVKEVRDAVYEVVHRVMASTGAFETNAMEINLWLDFLVLWKIEKSESIYVSVVDFLSRAVSSIAHNSYKYLDSLHSILNKFFPLEDTENSVLQRSLEDYDTSEVGPFVICALEKFSQLISKSQVPAAARSTVALYLVNVLHLLLKQQLNPRALAMVVNTLISRERESLPPEQANSPEWTALLALRESAQSLLSNDGRNSLRCLSTSSTGTSLQGSQAGKLAEVLKACQKDHDMTSEEKLSALASSMACVSAKELVDNFPLLVRFCLEDLEGDFSLPIALLGIHEGVLTEVSTAWPEFFTGALELVSSVKYNSEDILTVEKAKELTVLLRSSSVKTESYAICLLLLVSPFPVLFSSAMFARQPVLLTLSTFTSLLRAGLSRVCYRNWVCMGRLIVSGMKHLAALPVEEIGDGAPLQTCFSLIRDLMLPTTEQPMGGSVSSNKLIETVHENVIIDVLKHPAFYSLFMHGDRKPIPSMATCSSFSDLRRDTKDNKICDTSIRRIFSSAATCVHPIDCHILSLLKQVLDFSETVVNSLTNFSESRGVLEFRKEILTAYNPYALKAIGAFEKEVDESLTFGVVASPALFSVSVLIPYTHPSFLLSLFLSLLSKKALKVKSSKRAVSPHVLGMHFVTVFVDSFSGAASHLRIEGDGKDEAHLGAPSMYDLFEKVVDHVTGSPSIMADLCLLSFLQAPNLSQLPLPFLEQHFIHFTKTSTALACSTPLEVLRHCVCHPNRVTRKISFLLVRTNSVHLAELGRLIAVGTAQRGTSNLKLSFTSLGLAEMLLTRNVGNQKMEFSLSDEDLMCLLPAAQVYIAWKSRKADAKGKEIAQHIATVYAKLFTKQLKKWEKFVSESIAMDGVQDSSLTISPLLSRSDLYDTLLQFYNCSQLGQVVHMLQSCHTLHSLGMKVKTKLTESLLPEENVALVTQNLGLSAGEDISPFVCEAVARVDIIRHLLSSGPSSQTAENASSLETQEQTQTSDFTSLEKMSLWQKFLRSLMSTLVLLYKSTPLDGNRTIDTDTTETQSEAGRTHWVQFLEEYLLLQVTSVAKELAGFSLAISKYLPLYTFSMKTLLRYRYGETSAMQACRHLTLVVFQGLQSPVMPNDKSVDGDDVLELLIAHSKFLPSLLIVDSKRMHIPHISGKHAAKGTAFNSLSSVLSLIGSPLLLTSAKEPGLLANGDSVAEPVSALKEVDSSNVTDGSKKSREKVKHDRAKSAADGVDRLEIVKLLRVLLGVRLKQVTLGTLDTPSLPLDEVMSILLAAYGATLSLVDKEIFLLMQEIESHGGLGFSGLAGLDYLWGEAALKRRRAKAEEGTLNALKDESDSTHELRRQTFKEDLLIDPRRCGLAVLFFPLQRNFGAANIGQLGLANEHKESREGTSEQTSDANDEDVKDAAYDPAFILPFALHGLSIGCINAEEFVQLGLLAIAFASMSSAEESMRKAGYELLAKYYSVLEDGPSFKGRLQIRLLMTYVKNAVTEPWQRIPVVFAVFAAEASCILMHPESHQYATINRFLLRAPSLDLESIPLFQVMFGSGSVHYRSERLWMLRLLADGLRTSLDARVYRRKFVLELLMSFHDSSMADTFPRKWVLQVLYQAAGVRSFAQYLVEHTGLLSWLSSVAVNDIEGGLGLHDEGSGQIAFMALQVIERILSWGNLHRHFLLDCLEELSKAGHVFHQLLVRNPSQQYQNRFQRPTLKILLTLVSLSLKRRKHQTHFTLNLGGLVDVLHSVSSAVIPGTKSPILHMEDKALALQLVLHVTPLPVHSYEEKNAFFKVASWAQSAALDLERGSPSGKSSLSVNSNHLRARPEGKESLSEKLLRWLAASVVLGELAKEGSHPESRENFFSSSSVIGGLTHTNFTRRDTASMNLNEQLANLFLALEGYASRKTEGTSLVPVVAALVVLTRRTRSFIHPGDMEGEVAQRKMHSILELLLLELPAPEETNCSWQWSFNSPWSAREEAVQSTDESAALARYVSEICRTVLIFLQQTLSRQPTDYKSLLSHWESLLSWKPQTADEPDNDSIMEIVGSKLSRLRAKLRTTLQRIPAH